MDFIKIEDCPIRADDKVCMCYAPTKCIDVPTLTCSGIRLAYRAGFVTAEETANKNMEEIKAKLDEVFKKHGWGGEQDG